MLVDEENKVAFCPIPKSACSTGKLLVANISSHGKVGNASIHDTITKYGIKLRSPNHNLFNYTKFVFVRNPMDRVLSGYYDKMYEKNNFFGNAAKTMIKKFRPQSMNKCNESCDIPTFEEFVRMLVDNPSPFGWEPHFETSVAMCNPCSTQFNYVFKLETLQEDINTYLNEIYGRNVLQFLGNRRKSKRPHKIPNLSVKLIHLPEFKAIPNELIKKLYKRYQFDFELYGYSFDEKLNDSICL